jgi:hypothetical protein
MQVASGIPTINLSVQETPPNSKELSLISMRVKAMTVFVSRCKVGELGEVSLNILSSHVCIRSLSKRESLL